MSDIPKARAILRATLAVGNVGSIVRKIKSALRLMDREPYTPGTRGPKGDKLSVVAAKRARMLRDHGYKIDAIRSDLERWFGKKYNIGRISEALNPKRKRK